MRNLILLIGLLFLSVVHAQNEKSFSFEYLNEVVRSEKNQANKKMTFKVNQNTQNYDLKYHRLEWEVNPAVAQIKGIITSYFNALENLDQVVFELENNMTVLAVQQRGTNLSFTHTNGEVRIDLPATLAKGALDSLAISYQGNPVSSGHGSFEINTHGAQNTPVLWTLSEPYGAKGWWPCKQDLTDKIDSIDIFIKHPSAYKAASNGLLKSEISTNNQTTTHWSHRYPIPAYLIAIAVTNYEVYSHAVTNENFDIVNYVYPEQLQDAQSKTGVTADIMTLFSQLFEPYPFKEEKYGHAQFGWGGGMEHTTMSFMGSFGRSLIAHELAHQWFGNKITCGSWQDIWLNEGFATYLDGLVIENFDGENNFQNWRQILNQNVTAFTNGSTFVNDTTSVNRIFNQRLSYQKGALILHMLRYKLGDDNFFTGIKNYLADEQLAYGYAKTKDLQNHLEAASQEDLEEFFEDWFYGEGFPSYEVAYHQNNNQMLSLTVSQDQSHPSVDFFEMPLPIKVIGSNSQSEILRLEVTENNQSFSVHIPFEVSSIQIDPEQQIISRNNSAVLGVDPVDLDTRIAIYPNPVKNFIHIQNNANTKLERISIFDVTGKMVYQKELPENIVPLNMLKFGVHLLRLETNKGTIQKTIIKE